MLKHRIRQIAYQVELLQNDALRIFLGSKDNARWWAFPASTRTRGWPAIGLRRAWARTGYGHIALSPLGVPMRRGGIDIHPRDYAAYVGAKKDRTWGSVVQLHAFAAVYDIDVNVWTRESAMATFASSARWRRIINTHTRFYLNARGAKCRAADNRLGNARHFASELCIRISRKEASAPPPTFQICERAKCRADFA